MRSILTPADVAERLGIPSTKVYQLIGSGQLRAVDVSPTRG